jgi:plasmid stabilization system protein ParE/Arc/MetJ-type ribon-helix-helix transcriptional regulator
MAFIRTVSLDKRAARFLDAQVNESGSANASKVIQTSLELLETLQKGFAFFHEQLLEGEQSGASSAFDLDEFISRKGGSTGVHPRSRACWLTPKAQADVESIWDHGVAGWSVQEAEIYIRRLWHDIEAVTDWPDFSIPCDGIRPGLRWYASGGRVLYCRTLGQTVEFVRVMRSSVMLDYGIIRIFV